MTSIAQALRNKRDSLQASWAEKTGLTSVVGESLDNGGGGQPRLMGSRFIRPAWLQPSFLSKRNWKQVRDDFAQMGLRSGFNYEFPSASPSSRNKEGLGTFMGVFVPTLNSFIGIVAMTRWGWAVGNAGLFLSLIMLSIGGLICAVTITSVSAISTNDKIGAGGAYFMISRSLGPQIGGTSGALFFLAQALSTTLHLLGLSEIIRDTAYSTESGATVGWNGQIVLYAVLINIVVLLLSLLGARFFARVSFVVLIVVMVGLLLAFFSLFRSSTPALQTSIKFHPSIDTLRSNLWPDYDQGLDFMVVFGVMMPCMVGVLAGANLSGSLRNASESIPSGSLSSLLTTLGIYALLIIGQAASFDRSQLQQDVLVLQKISFIPQLYFIATALSTFSSAFSGFVGASTVLAAVSEDELFPWTGWFAHLGVDREPRRAMLMTFFVSTLALFFGNLNNIAPVLSTFFFLTFVAVNLACGLLHLSRTPYFRPEFKYFSWKLSFTAVITCFFATFLIDGFAAMVSFGIAGACFFYLVTHGSPKKNDWQQITQALLFKAALAYVLRLDTRKQHVKNWRPQILAITSDLSVPKGVIFFGNYLKKKGLYVVSHLVIGKVDPLKTAIITKMRGEALKTLEHGGIQAQLEIVICPSFANGTQSLLQVSGMGGLKPNTFLTDLPTGDGKRDGEGGAAPDEIAASIEPASGNLNFDNEMWPVEKMWDWGEISRDDWFEAVMLTRLFGLNVVMTNGLQIWEANVHHNFSGKTIDVWIDAKELGLLPFPSDLFDPSNIKHRPASINRISRILEYAHCFHENRDWKKCEIRVLLLSCHEYPGSGQDLEFDAFQTLLHECRIHAQVYLASFAQLQQQKKKKKKNHHHHHNFVVDDDEDNNNNDDDDDIHLDSDSEEEQEQEDVHEDRLTLLNKLYKLHSSNAGVLFIQPDNFPETISSNPPAINAYIQQLQVICQDLPPVGMVFSGPLQAKAGVVAALAGRTTNNNSNFGLYSLDNINISSNNDGINISDDINENSTSSNPSTPPSSLSSRLRKNAL